MHCFWHSELKHVVMRGWQQGVYYSFISCVLFLQESNFESKYGAESLTYLVYEIFSRVYST